MKLLQEVTDWKGQAPNHLYLFDDSETKIIAYRPDGAIDFFKFKEPIRIDTRRRKFVASRAMIPKELLEAAGKSMARRVEGSKGQVYTVTDTTCTCSGFKFRGVCKHLTQIA